MRSMLTAITFAAVLLGAASAHAETRTFIITNKEQAILFMPV